MRAVGLLLVVVGCSTVPERADSSSKGGAGESSAGATSETEAGAAGAPGGGADGETGGSSGAPAAGTGGTELGGSGTAGGAAYRCDYISECKNVSEDCGAALSTPCAGCRYGSYSCGAKVGFYTDDGSVFPCSADCAAAASAARLHCGC